MDLFVNYDCDLESSNLFERMVADLVKVAQTPVGVKGFEGALMCERTVAGLVKVAQTPVGVNGAVSTLIWLSRARPGPHG